jgi:hypothetical protein
MTERTTKHSAMAAIAMANFNILIICADSNTTI